MSAVCCQLLCSVNKTTVLFVILMENIIFKVLLTTVMFCDSNKCFSFSLLTVIALNFSFSIILPQELILIKFYIFRIKA